MLDLNDGRDELWQWDTGRTLDVDADCTQVHFSNNVFGRSIDVDVVGGVAIIPDILLQTDKDLNVWAFSGTAENGYTKISKTFKVNRRNKPADYVFKPPDQTSLEEIKERVGYLESMQDPGAIKNAVEDYLERNPVEATVTAENIQSALGYTPADSADLADKLPKSPTYWEQWTADEQTTARIRMGAVSATDVSTAITEALSAIGVAEEGSY